MDLVINPLAIAAATQHGGSAPTLTPGQIVEAVVLALLKDGAVRLSIAETVLDVRSELPLTPGTTLRFAVKSAPDGGLRLTPIPGSIRPPAEIASGPAGPIPSTTAASVREKSPQAAPIRATNTPSNQPEQVLRVELSAAAARPPVLAESLSAATARALASAGLQIKAQQSPAPVSPGSVAPVPPAGAGLQHHTVEPVRETEPPRADPAQALASAIRHAAPRQNGLGPLFANVEQLLRMPLPKDVLAAAGGLLRTRVGADAPIDATTIKAALKRSGLFLEQQIASGNVPRDHAPDIKLALIVLRHALRSFIAAPDAELAKSELASPGRSAPPLAPPPAPLEHPRPSTPPPIPYRGAPTAAQPAAMPTLGEMIAPGEAGEQLLAQTEGALARQTLLQAASLPDRTDQARSEAQNQRWLFEMPITSAQGTGIAQFEIGREGGRAGDREEATPIWRARFSIDIEPIGPVHAQVALVGERAAVTLWAERDGVATRLREASSVLAESLKHAELEPSEIQVREGSPRRPQPEPALSGRFLDRAS